MFDDMKDSQRTEGAGFHQVRDNPNTPSAEQILKAYQTVYLFKWLFPENVIQQQLKKSHREIQKQTPFSNFKNTFIPTKPKDAQQQQQYWSKFSDIDRLLEDDDSESEDDYKESDEDEEMLEDLLSPIREKEEVSRPAAATDITQSNKVEQKQPPFAGFKVPPVMGKLNLGAVQPQKT